MALSKLERLKAHASALSQEYRAWARVDWRLTRDEREAKEQAYAAWQAAERAVDRERKRQRNRALYR